jgi:formylglycine-generating enzyme required for sulfatase activity/WD40 repeat protein/tRNA A-37 threonylcarbamoyl transferase component Bud32
MNRLTACPDSEFFSKLGAGRTLPDQIDELAQHLDYCPACLQRVAKMAAGKAETPALAQLIIKCEALSAILNTGVRLGEADTDSGGVAPVADADDNLLAFLSPAQGPDELGWLGNYRVLSLLGQGGMGLVFAAEDPVLKRRLALKVMKAEVAVKAQNRQRFLREAQAAAKVEHPHIVPIYQVGEANGVPFIAMPFLKGEPLDARLRHSRLDQLEIMTIGRQVAEGLAAAHEQGLIHRDIKPGNIWLEAADDSSIRVKILDFGLARLSGEEGNLTQSGAIVGTPAYMAPEQARSKPVDHRADLFSLGCVLYEASAGQRPFTGSDTMGILSSLALDTPEAPHLLNDGLSLPLSQLIMKLLEKDPAKRPQSGREVAAALKRMQPENTIVVVAQSRPAAPDPWADIDASDGSITECVADAPAAKPKHGHSKKYVKPAERKPFPTKRLLLAAGAAAVVVLAVASLFVFQTRTGVVRLETNDPDIDVIFDNGRTVIKGAEKQPITLNAGEHGLLVKRGDFELETEKFTLKKGETVTLKIDLFKDKALVMLGDKVIGRKEIVVRKPAPSPKPSPVVRADYALAFDGQDSYVKAPKLVFDGTTSLTLEAWALLERPASSKTVEYLMGNSSASGFGISNGWPPTYPGTIGELGGPKWNFSFFLKEKGYARLAEKQPLPRQQWVHIAAVYAKDHEMRLFVDGQRQGRASAEVAHLPSKEAFCLGYHGGKEHFQGRMTEVRISKVARYDNDFIPVRRHQADADTFALYHFDEGSGDELKDSSGNENHGKIVGAKWVKLDEPAGAPSLLKAPFTKAQAEKVRAAWAAYLNVPERKQLELPKGVKLELVLIPPGEFLMGTPGNKGNEVAHPVTISKPFYMAVNETTQEQYESVIGKNPSDFSATGSQAAMIGGTDTSQFPVENVNWFEAEAYATKIKAQLPTEAQWEFACRAGTISEYHFGDSLNGSEANCVGSKPHGAKVEGPNQQRPTKVKKFAPNNFGLYDMHGNVREWCRDWYAEKTDDLPGKDPERTAKLELDRRVGRGGSWLNAAKDCRSASRFISSGPADHVFYAGFRVIVPVANAPAGNPPLAGPSPYDAVDPAKLIADPALPWRPKELVAVAGEQRFDSWRRAVTKVHLSKDGKTLFASNQDGTIAIRDADTGRVRQLFEHRVWWNYGSAPFAVSPDERWLVYQKNDMELVVWDLTGNREVKNLPLAHHVAFSPNGRHLLVLKLPKLRIIEPAADWKLKQEIDVGAPGGIFALIAVSRDSKRVAVILDAANGSRVRIFDIGSGDRVSDLQVERRITFGIFGVSSDDFIFGGYTNPKHLIGRIDLKNGKIDAEKEFYNCQGAALSPDGKQLLVSQFGDFLAVKPDDLSRTWLKSLSGFNEIRGIAYSGDGERVALADSSGFLGVHDAKTGELVRKLPPYHMAYSRLFALPDGRAFISGANIDSRLFQFASGTDTYVPKIDGMDSAIPTPDGRLLIVALAKENRVAIVDWQTNTPMRDLKIGLQVLAAVPIGEGRKLLLRTKDSFAIADSESGALEKQIPTPGDAVLGMAVDPTGRRAALARKDDVVEVFDLQSAKRERRIDVNYSKDPVWRAHPILSRDGQWLACGQSLASFGSGPYAGKVRLWSTATGDERLLTVPKDWRPGFAVDISPSGEELANGGFDGCVHFWDIKTGGYRRSIRVGPANGVILNVAYAPDGRHLVVNTGSGMVLLLRLAPPPSAADRKAAETLLRHCRRLTLRLRSGELITVEPQQKLPDEPFALVGIYVRFDLPKDLRADFAESVLIPAIAELRSLKAIDSNLNLGFSMPPELLGKLADLPVAQTLTRLYGVGAFYDKNVETYKRFPNLSELGTHGWALNDNMLERLAELPKLSEFGVFQLPERCTKRGLAALCKLPLKKIVVDDFWRPDGSHVLRAFCALFAAMPTLQSLHLTNTDASDEVLPELAKCKALVTLDLRWAKKEITDAGLEHLKGMKTLRELDVGGTKVTEAGAKNLAAVALPQCLIRYGNNKTIQPKLGPELKTTGKE